MELRRAFGYICVFLLCSLSTVWLSRLPQSDPTFGWIVPEAKPTFAVAWLVVAIVFFCAFVSFVVPSVPRRGAIALPEDQDVSPVQETTATTFASSSFLLFSLVVNAATASFALFKRGVPWPQTESNSDNAIAFMVFFLHGVANCLMVCVLTYAIYHCVNSIRRRAPAVSDAETNESSEKEALDT
ncbi:hypothetical protein C8R45DRAFT_81667 [Mycena sanguinolenta]|nr:hypothetical protein C8R45DRAFT_81667 [Mycena sanguinolenta]